MSGTSTLVATAPAATPANGRIANGLTHFGFKILLKPDRFTSIRGFREFGRLVRRTARYLDTEFQTDSKLHHRPRVREVLFLDTPDFRLYNNGFILRRRISYVDGFPVRDPEIVFKFRHTSEEKVTAVDVRPQIQGAYRVKLKEQVIPLTAEIGGYRTLYSHNCQFPLTHVHEGDRTALATLIRLFPALSVLRGSDGEHVALVNEGYVEELL